MSRRLASLSIIIVGALVGACADEPTAPRGAPLIGAAGPSSRLGVPTLRRNSVKYRDAGMKPATGRSGSATLAARALQGRDGITTLELTTSSFESAAAAPGNIDKVQVKLLENNKVGRQIFVQNFGGLTGGGTWSQVVPVGSARTIQVQANVSGVDPNRVGVVVVRERVKRRPDLVVSEIFAPEKAAPGAYVQIMAVVSELNGDVGANANCVLYVDKVAVDRANGIWVDAGRTVSCAFGHRFTTAGTRVLRVEVDGVNPGDWNAANNSRSGSILVEDPVNLFYEASVEDYAENTSTRNETTERWEDRYGPSYTSTTITEVSRVERRRHSVMDVYTPWKPDGSIAFPMRRLEVSHASGGLAVAASFSDVVPTKTEYWVNPGEYEEETRCAKGHADGTLGVMIVNACLVRRRNISGSASAGDPPADGNWYSRFWVQSVEPAGDVVYNSVVEAGRYSVDGDPASSCVGEGPDGSYCWYNITSNSEPPNAGDIPFLGTTYQVDVVLAGADGVAQNIRADVALDRPHRPFELDGNPTDRVETNVCTPFVQDYWDTMGFRFTTTECSQVLKVATGKSGAVSRLQPAPTP